MATFIFVGVLVTLTGFPDRSMAEKIADTFEVQVCFVAWFSLLFYHITASLSECLGLAAAFCLGLMIWPHLLKQNFLATTTQPSHKKFSRLTKIISPKIFAIVSLNVVMAFLLCFSSQGDSLTISLNTFDWKWHGLAFLAFLVQYGRFELAAIAYLPILLWTLVARLAGYEVSPLLLGFLVALSFHVLKPHLNAYKYRQARCKDWPAALTGWLYVEILICGVMISYPGSNILLFTLSSFGLGVSILWWPSLWCIRRGFSMLTMAYNQRGFGPITFSDLFAGISTLGLFILASFSLSGLVPPWRHLPLSKANKKFTVHWLVSKLCRFILNFHFTTTQRDEGLKHLDFSQPRLLMANHQSHIDLVMILKLHPKIIVLTNEWVWNNLFYGTIVRYLDYIPSHLGLEKSLVGVREKIQQGYSVLVFPEGTRTPHGKIQRYRQGAFQLAHALNLPIQPILIHGAHDCLPKREFYLHPGQLSLKIFPVDATPIVPDENNSCGSLAKAWTQKMRQWELDWKRELEVNGYYSPAVMRHYLYKGPVLEWYLKIKLKLEHHYQAYHEILPKSGTIVDMGCGYGLVTHHLKIRSPERHCLGIDLDSEKIAVAQGIHMADHPCEFSVANLNDWLPPAADAYMFNDVLHYLPHSKQQELLTHCSEHLRPNGVILIREADGDDHQRTQGTRWTELWSTRLLGFNCHDVPLCYLKGSELEQWAETKNLSFERGPSGSRTSNTLFILRHHQSQRTSYPSAVIPSKHQESSHVSL